MKRQSLILPVVLAALLISGCNRRGTTESTTPTSSTPTSSQTSSETSSQGTSVSESSSEEQSSQGSSEETVVYTVTIGETQHNLVEGEAPRDYLAQYYVEGLTVTKDQAIAFKEDGVNLNVHKDNEGDTDDKKCNAVANEQGDFVIHNDATNVGVYLKLDADQNWAFWVTGYVKGEGDDPTPGLAQYVLIETGEEQEKVPLVANPDNNAEVMAKGVELNKDQQVALCVGDNDWRKYDDINAEAPGLAHVSRHNQDQDASDGNIVINDKGTYDFYIKKVKENNAKTIWLVYNLPAPSADAVATVKVNAGEAKTIAKVEDAVLLNTQVAEYKTTISVAKDDELTFFLDGEAIVKYGAEPDDEEHGIRNNVQGSDKVNEGKLVVLKNATDVELIFKTWENGGCSMWLAGGPEIVKYNVTFNMTKAVESGKALYVAGDFTEWQKAPVKLTKGEENAWSKTLQLSAGEYEYKFLIAPEAGYDTETAENNTWEQFGEGINRNLIVVDEAVTVNATWEVLPRVAENWYLVGTINGWDVTDTTYKLDLHEDKKDDADQYAIHDVAIDANAQIKFVKDNDYEKGQYPASGNITVNEAGVYNIYFVPSKDIEDWGGNRYYLNRTGDLVHTYGLVGQFGEDNKWDDDQAMAVNEGVATIENVAMAVNDEFRVRADGKWIINFGWTDVNAMTAGKFEEGTENNNIKCLVAGNYDIKLTIATGKLMLKVHGGEDPVVNEVTVTFRINYDTHANGDLYLLGIKGWEVNANTKMTWTADNWWTYTVDLTIGETYSFKCYISIQDKWENFEGNRSLEVTAETPETITLTWGTK